MYDSHDQQEPPYEDLLLNPSKLKQVVKALSKRQKHSHDNYRYMDTEGLEKEINDFFSNSELRLILQDKGENDQNDDRLISSEEYHHQQQQQNIKELIKKLEYHPEQQSALLHQDQLNAAEHVIHILLGHDDRNIENLIHAAELVVQCGGLTVACRILKSAFQHIRKTSDLSKKACLTLDILLTLVYPVIEVLCYKKRTGDDTKKDDLDPSFVESLFCFLGEIQDHQMVHLPMRKLMSLTWKCMLLNFGGLEDIRQIKQTLHKKSVPITNKTSFQSYYKFLEQTTEKYGGYNPTLPSDIPSSLAVKSNSSSISAMGLSYASSIIDLPYQSFYHSTNTVSSPSSSPPSPSSKKKKSQQQQQQQQNAFVDQDEDQFPSEANQISSTDGSVILPLDQTGPSVPYSIIEAGNVYLSHLNKSRTSQQLIQQREQAIQKWQDQRHRSSSSSDKYDHHILNQFEGFYKAIVPHLQNVIAILLKQLLTTILPGESQGTSEEDRMDEIRNNENLCKSISGTLILLLRWTKLSHMLKFEYISQLLVDSGCILLILKIFGLQDVIELASRRTDIETLRLFRIDQMTDTYTNGRNMFWMINLLCVLQKLTKAKSNRVMIMVQYKSTAIFKKLLKISHPVLELYTLKILKSQVPYQTKKWRTSNMKIISAIYLRCNTSLNDDWMSKNDTEEDLDGKAEEINLRLLIRIYHGERYLPELLPPFDDAIHNNGSTHSSSDNTSRQLEPASVNGNDIGDSFDTDDFELDPSFVATYEIWLDEEVYNASDKQLTQPIIIDDIRNEEEEEDDQVEEEEEEEDVDDDTSSSHTNDIIGTPVPSSPIATDYFSQMTCQKLYYSTDNKTKMDESFTKIDCRVLERPHWSQQQQQSEQSSTTY
ncbi:uncharacterized protein BX664DRAFT_362144 [Halteromyces radiatus]|uniref:uncharacterized protein n=1 Tax=Halteromyces radiatus TaxID=101107 RepID=UPI002220F994|nr:uncharacterized protein BX664DRAFT_362144 [Halteromyces radiatus]KAI8080024.1 hypothetical protein BX664DRAFT_362144 [Halteromyces radiatus]